jgi:hypothetical protein
MSLPIDERVVLIVVLTVIVIAVVSYFRVFRRRAKARPPETSGASAST